MATLKKLTRVGSDVRQIARLLQAKAPEGHMLAYITPEEAELLKSRGGSGKEHADTGIPSYEMGATGGADYGDYYGVLEAPPNLEPVQARSDLPVASVSAEAPMAKPDYSQYVAPSASPPVDYSAYTRGMSATPASQDFVPGAPVPLQPFGFQSLPPAMTGESVPTTFDTTPEKGIMERLSEATGMKPETLSRLGLAGGLAALGSYQGGKARKQAEEAKREQQKLAEPYQAKGAELQRQAQAGELTPVGQQQLQAVQAQAAQQAAGRGGAVSAAQTQAQIEAFRNQLLQQQYDYGLKLSGIGDNIALGAIKTGLEADRYVQQLSNNFYTNMANIVGGLPAQTPQQYRSA